MGMTNEERYLVEKYDKEYKCNYQIDEYTESWGTIGKRDRYKCPECYYIGSKNLCSCGEGY